ncbi:NYN domain-containing protein [Viridibacillus arvi]|uniref:NYN domain-containing protein n=1 Tax=Viridibacillus arvi TaxID=263475 RepID=UPI0034CDE83C
MKHSRNAAILVDEMNVIGQLHRKGIKGIRPWNIFYQEIQRHLGIRAEKHFYCSNVPKEQFPERFVKRLGFFNDLRRSEISVHEGFVVTNARKQLIEKGVDVLLAMDLSQFAMEGVQDIVICTGDGDLVPAIKRAQTYGARIHVVVSKFIPAANIVDVADTVISLETILARIPEHKIMKLQNNREAKIHVETVLV